MRTPNPSPARFVAALAGVLLAGCHSGSVHTPPPDSGGDNVDSGPSTGPHTASFDAGSVNGDGGACSSCTRDWTASPAVAQVDGVSELWVLSDIHADYNALTKLLSGAGIIAGLPSTPSAVVWQQATATFVVIGDMIDKGPDAPDVVRLLIALQSSAASASGRVIVTMGNHEAEFLANPENSDATKTGTEEGLDPELTSIGLTPAQTADGEDDIGAFFVGLPVAARVDDWFFVHAGNTGGASISALAASIEGGYAEAGFGTQVLIGDDSMLEARLSSSPPQWWDATGDAQALLTQWTQALGVSHLVMGHQPGKVGFADETSRAQDQMYAAYGGLLFLIDTGMSIGADDTGGALLHVKHVGASDESWEEVFPDGSKQSL